MVVEYIQVGKLKKTFGNQGRLSFSLFVDDNDIVSVGKPLFVFLDGIHVPFFVSKNGLEGDKLKFDDVNDLEEAEQLSGKSLFLPKDEVHFEQEEPDLEFGYLKGYRLFDQEKRDLGEIIEIARFPMQEMAILKKDVLVPLNKRLIIEINRELKHIFCEIPQGLLD